MIAAARWDPITMASVKPFGVEVEESAVEMDMEKEKDQSLRNPFARSSKLGKSPKSGATPPVGSDQLAETPKSVKKPAKLTIAELLKDGKGEMSSLEYATKLVDDLSAFVASKNNVHGDIKILVTKIQKAMLDLNKEQKVREEPFRKKAVDVERLATPRANSKRQRPSPETATPQPKVPRNGHQKPRENVEERWQFVGPKRKPPKPPKPKPDKKPQPRDARKVRPKSDALLIEAKDSDSYADLLRRVKADPDLKDLGQQVARIRRTKNGEMLFELKGDTSVKSGTYKEMIERSLGGDATVRALTQEIVVEVSNLDEITTEEELREALIEHFSLGEIGRAAKVKLRKAFSGTQTATIKLPVAEANKLLEAGKVKVGWTICHLRTPRTQLLRCYKCLGFGHVAKQCTLTDRSKRCWRCGEDGHVSKTCKNKPKCMLCQKGERNDHATGSLRCKAYMEAKARQGWR